MRLPKPPRTRRRQQRLPREAADAAAKAAAAKAAADQAAAEKAAADKAAKEAAARKDKERPSAMPKTGSEGAADGIALLTLIAAGAAVARRGLSKR